MTEAVTEVVFSTGEVADMFGVDLKTIHSWIKRGRGPECWLTPGRHRRFPEKSLKEWATRMHNELGMPIPKELAS